MTLREIIETAASNGLSSLYSTTEAFRPEDADLYRRLSKGESTMASAAAQGILEGASLFDDVNPKGLPSDQAERQTKEDNTRIAATLSKYFDAIDNSHWDPKLHDDQLTRTEIFGFLISDAGGKLQDQELRDILTAAKRYYEIADLHIYRDPSFETEGIDRADIAYLAKSTSTSDQRFGVVRD